MSKSIAWLWTAVVVVLCALATSLFFWAEPKMIIPSLIGVVIFVAILYLFYRKVSPKPEDEQKRIAISMGRIASVAIIVMLCAFFYFGGKQHDMSAVEFFRLLTGL